ncbi:hypothetical protein B6A42_08710 [Vibrio coralliilyticus]|nr:hypothetical protein B6A42_08710 [Vibrio coralliilyticus]
MTNLHLTNVTDLVAKPVTQSKLILSLFPGIDLFSKPFEELGFSVVRGPDTILGQDIRSFHVPKGVFAGVIGGSPCQEFSSLLRTKPTGYGLEMLKQYKRVVQEACPNWWLLENVPRVPDLKIEGYSWQRFPLDLGWFSESGRLRHFQFGSIEGKLLNPPIAIRESGLEGAAVANDDRSFAKLLHLQGLSSDFDLPSFTVEGKKKAVGNGVPIPLGRELAKMINQTCYGVTEPGAKTVTTSRASETLCGCGCGRSVHGKATYAGSACRKRAQRKRQKEMSN